MEKVKKEAKPMTGFDLKIIAIITMFIDHFASIVLEGYMENVPGGEKINGLYILCRCIGRIAFPIYIYLLVEGFTYTHDRLKYGIRLALFALISEVPFDIGFMKSFFDIQYQNVFFTLLLGYIFMCACKWIHEKEIKPVPGYIGLVCGSLLTGAYFGIFIINLFYSYSIDLTAPVYIIGIIAFVSIVIFIATIHINKFNSFNMLSQAGYTLLVLSALCFLADILNTDYSGFGVLAIALAYGFRSDKKKRFLMSMAALICASGVEAVALLDYVFIKRYDGQRGKSMKYFFYAFYPAHIALISLLAYLLGYLKIG